MSLWCCFVQRSAAAFVDFDRENFSYDFDMIPLLFPVYSKTIAFGNMSVICYNIDEWDNSETYR